MARIAIQRTELKNRLAWLDQIESHIKAALDYEIESVGFDQRLLFAEDPVDGDRGPIAQFLREALSDLKPKTLAELKDSASLRGINFSGKNPGRVLHFALVGMAQNKLVESLGDGVWRLRQQSTPANENDQLREAPDTPLM